MCTYNYYYIILLHFLSNHKRSKFKYNKRVIIIINIVQEKIIFYNIAQDCCVRIETKNVQTAWY